MEGLSQNKEGSIQKHSSSDSKKEGFSWNLTVIITNSDKVIPGTTIDQKLRFNKHIKNM